jgi:hypothetical protein
VLRLLPKSRGNRGNRGEEPQDEYHSDDLDGQTTLCELSWLLEPHSRHIGDDPRAKERHNGIVSSNTY